MTMIYIKHYNIEQEKKEEREKGTIHRQTVRQIDTQKKIYIYILYIYI